MKGSDYLPLGLLGVVATFIVYQVATRAPAPPATATPAPTAPSGVTVSPQGAPAPQVAIEESARTAADPAPADSLTRSTTASGPAPAANIEATRALIRDGAPGTYFTEMLVEQDQLIMRWPERRMEPLRVWIDRQSSLKGWDVSYALAAEAAFEEWQRAGFPLRFDVVRDSAVAEIHIFWIASFPPSEREKLGMARKTRDQQGWLRAAEVTVATADRSGNPLPAATITGTVRHEIGHALGLGHSPNPADVMFPESRTTVISPADRATLHLLYILPPGSLK